MADAAAEPVELHSYYMSEPVFDGQVYVTEAGRDHSRTIVLVHGLGPNSARIWQAVIPALARDYHVIAVDLPGFGHSSKGNKLYSPQRYTRFLHYLIERSANEPFMLVGHSMGANVAIEYALSHPQQFVRLVLADAAGVLHRFAYSRHLSHFGIEHIPEFYPRQNEELRDWTGRLLESLSLNSDWVSRAEALILEDPQLRQTILRGESNTIAGYAMAMADYSARLPTLRQPTLLLWGELDAVTPLRTARVLARRLPQAALVTLPEAGHSPMSDQPQLFSAWLQRFAAAEGKALQTLMQAHAYTLPGAPADPDAKDHVCRNKAGQTLEGEFGDIRIEGCRDVTLRNLSARRIVISDSVVELQNCHVRADQPAVQIHHSQVKITACRVQGAPALSLDKAEVDVAGSELSGADYAVRQIGSGAESRILFSVSALASRFIDKTVHGPVRLASGEGM